MELRTEYARSTTEKMLAAARRIAEIATDTQAQFSDIVGQHMFGGGKELADAMQKMFSFNPAAGQAVQTAMTTLQQSLDTARSAYDQIAKVSTDAFTSMGRAASGAAGAKRTKS
jgi:hypothetical protein